MNRSLFFFFLGGGEGCQKKILEGNRYIFFKDMNVESPRKSLVYTAIYRKDNFMHNDLFPGPIVVGWTAVSFET